MRLIKLFVTLFLALFVSGCNNSVADDSSVTNNDGFTKTPEETYSSQSSDYSSIKDEAEDYDEMIENGTCDWASECGDYYLEKNQRELDELEEHLGY